MDAFTNAYDEKVRPLMDKIDQVRSLLSSSDNYGINFPNVVVVGDQSSGKSTLLEALSLVELPKGAGIVTRCPLVLRLRKSSRRQVYHLQADGKKILLDESKLNLMTYIEEETKKLAGASKNVVNNLIELQVEDPNVRDLTVVDLPGIARNPIGDQPTNIHKQTTDLIRQFICQEGSVILCVFPANVDVATVESFTLAREFDPSGTRTIGVITKSDLASDQNVLVQQLLMENVDVLQLKLGFVAVRNRSTTEKLSLEEARTREKEFFSQHSASNIVGWHCLGINALINRLADLYSDRVKETFPRMRTDIQKKLKDVREQLSKFPPDLETPSARLAKYHELADFYIENILKVHFGSSNDGRHASMINTLHGKFKQFEDVIHKYTKELFTSKYRSKVQTAMSGCFGEQLPNFLPHPVLKRLICEKLDQLSSAANMLINECFAVASRTLLNNDDAACQNDILLMKLLPAFRNVVVLHLSEKKQVVHDQLQELIRLEKHDPYTTNHFYMDKVTKFKEHTAKQTSNKAAGTTTSSSWPGDNEDANDRLLFDSISNDDQAVQDMLISIFSYWGVLTKRFTDYTALSIRAGCVFDVCSGIRERLRHIPVEQCDFVDAYLAEDASTRTKRQQLQQTKDRLEKVDAILGGHNVIGRDSNTMTDLMSVENDASMTLDALANRLSHTDTDDNGGQVVTVPIFDVYTASASNIRPK